MNQLRPDTPSFQIHQFQSQLQILSTYVSTERTRNHWSESSREINSPDVCQTRNMKSYNQWINAVVYQCVWFGSVILQDGFLIPAIMLISLHVWLVNDPGKELSVMLVCGSAGVLTDMTLTAAGLFVFEPALSVSGLPLWLVSIWIAFVATLRHCFRFLVDRAVLGIVMAALGAPLSYLAAARLGAVEFPHGMLVTWVTLVPVWACLMAGFIAVTRSIEGMFGKEKRRNH